jgi:hypothetical protein
VHLLKRESGILNFNSKVSNSGAAPAAVIRKNIAVNSATITCQSLGEGGRPDQEGAKSSFAKPVFPPPAGNPTGRAKEDAMGRPAAVGKPEDLPENQL